MTRRALSAAAVTAVALGGLTGCLPTLAAESTAPPGRTARLDPVTGFWGIQHYRLELSQGVAIAVACNAPGGPCEKLGGASDDPAIAEVRPAALTALRTAGYANQQPASAVVVVGKAPGATTVRLRSSHGGRDIHVTVVPPPAPAAIAAAAAR